MRRRVVITGIGVISAVGNDRTAFWNGILESRSGAGPITSFDASQYRTRIAMPLKDFDPLEHLDRKTLRNIDLFSQYALVASKEAREDAGLELTEKDDPRRFGVLTGSGIGGINEIEHTARKLFEKGPERISPFFIPKMMINAASGQLAIYHGFQGPNFATVSACASAQHALGFALDQIGYGACDVVLAGGSEAAISPLGIGGFCAMKAMSTRNDEPTLASRPFTRSRDGFVMGEGAAMFVFESEERARNRGAKIYCEVLSFGMTDDAHHMAAPLPDGSMAAAAMSNAIVEAGIETSDVDYINAHGTSTPLNDVMESRAIRRLFGAHADKMMVSSTKSQVGHLLGASGAVELAAVAMGIHQNVVPPTINQDDPDPDCDLDYVPNEARESRIRYALSNSFGFGGHNACLCLGRYEG